MVLARLGMARQHQMAPVGGRHMDVDHLDGGELLDDGAWGDGLCVGRSRRRRSSFSAMKSPVTAVRSSGSTACPNA